MASAKRSTTGFGAPRPRATLRCAPSARSPLHGSAMTSARSLSHGSVMTGSHFPGSALTPTLRPAAQAALLADGIALRDAKPRTRDGLALASAAGMAIRPSRGGAHDAGRRDIARRRGQPRAGLDARGRREWLARRDPGRRNGPWLRADARHDRFPYRLGLERTGGHKAQYRHRAPDEHRLHGEGGDGHQTSGFLQKTAKAC